MPGMTTMPILQSAPPANSNPVSGTIASANTADNLSAGVVDPRTGNTTGATSADTASIDESGDAGESFAAVLQRQMAQTTPSETPVPDFLPIVESTLPVRADSGSIAESAPQAVLVQTLVSDLSNLVDWLAAHRATATTASTDLASAEDTGIPGAGAVAEFPDLLQHALPTNTSEVADPSGSDLAARVAVADGQAAENMAQDGSASGVPYIQVLQRSQDFKPGLAIDDQRPAGAGKMLLTPALDRHSPATAEMPTPVLAQPQTAMEDDAPRSPAEFLLEAAGKSAEFAVAALTEVTPPQSREPVNPATSFESMLAAAQAVSQHRASGAHVSNSPGTPLPVATPMGTRGWDGEVADKLVWMVGRQEQRAELVLNPPQMGRIEVSLSMSDGQTSALFVSANPAVRDALEAALPRLRELLADAGVSLGQTQVGADSGNNAGNSSTNTAENRDNSGRGLSNNEPAAGHEILRQIDAPQWLKRGNGLVDTFA